MDEQDFILELEQYSALLTQHNAEVIGCTKEQIQDLEAFHKLQLPKFYKIYLRYFGVTAGALFLGSDAYYDCLIGSDNITQGFIELLHENNITPPDHLFAILLHQGYAGEFFTTKPYMDDPIIYNYCEGRNIQEASLFSKNILTFFQEHIDYWKKGIIKAL
ncbi:hypothetical protein [Commensalibacter communis]|uniref:hypothetical protein n=1 Tax=Commensalibacter communis TaxID=2972786 RepID=UPI0022FF52DD|nr:hypothetical protein [Commensalibacter communis]CAI3951379.1 unnamed protein product [Commensalibacter communis]CAI3956863.1 unnamed protein product [Commensalibacter communis]